MANAHRRELGFVRTVTLAASIHEKEILVAENDGQIVGFVHYHHRRDKQTTLYNIVVSPQKRMRGIGKRLVNALAKESRSLDKRWIVLKCPEDLLANKFYHRIGFRRWRKEPGKQRALIVWRLAVAR
jgi:N-acetylglutamate synthase-like GNAT family acetyltransferase